jgi:hypothetical protein
MESGSRVAAPVSISVSHDSRSPVTHIRVSEVGKDWSSPQAILDSILYSSQPKNDQEKALCIYQYVVDHCYADAYRSTWDQLYSITKALNCYGYGNCDFESRLFTGICEEAGLASNELGVNMIHTMSEVFFNKGWRLFDTYFGTYYLNKDNSSIAGWDDLMADNSLILRSGIAGFFPERNEWLDDPVYGRTHYKGHPEPWPSDADILPTLRTGETLTYFRDGGMDYFDNLTDLPYLGCPHSKVVMHTAVPTVNGWDLPASQHYYHKYDPSEVNRLNPPWRLKPYGRAVLENGEEGSYNLDIVSSYPICSATAHIRFTIKGDGEVALFGERTTYPESSQEICRWTKGRNHNETVDLKPFLNSITREFATYSYRLRLEAKAEPDDSITLRSMTVDTVSEVAFNALPKVGASDWVVSSSGDPKSTLKVVVNATEPDDPPQIPEILNTKIVLGATDDLTLQWRGELDPHPGFWTMSRLYRTSSQYYKVQISPDSQFRWRLDPVTNLIDNPLATSWTFKSDLFPTGEPLYWRVRVVDQERALVSPWSNIGVIRREMIPVKEANPIKVSRSKDS